MKFQAIATAVTGFMMLIAPVAAQAGTKAASVSVPVTYGNRSTAPVASKKKAIETGYLVLGALGVGAAGVGVAALAGAFDSEDDRSPGASN